MSPRPRFSRHTRSILVIWVLVFAAFAVAAVVAYPRLSDLALENSVQNVVESSRLWIQDGNAGKAVSALEGYIAKNRVTEAEPMFLLAEAYGVEGENNRQAHWLARARFAEAYNHDPIPTTTTEIAAIWKPAVEAGRRAIDPALEKPGVLERDLLEPIFLELMADWYHANHGPMNQWMRSLETEDLLGLILASGNCLIRSDGKIGATGVQSKVSISVKSSGNRYRTGARIRIGDAVAVDVDEYQRGFHVAAFAPGTGEPVGEAVQFDLKTYPEQSRDLYRFVHDLPAGTGVAIALATTIDPKADTWYVERALEEIGASLPAFRLTRARLIPSQPLAVLGVRGAAEGTGLCLYGDAERSKAFIVVVSG